MKIIFTYLFFLGFTTCSLAQIIWQENFDTYPDGTTTGTANRWTSVCSACVTGDFFEVRNSAFSGQDVNDFSTWESESINIAGFSNVSFSLDAIEVGDHEGPGCNCSINIDYFDVSYSINGGAFVIIENWNGDGGAGHTLTGDSQNGTFLDNDWSNTTIIQDGLVGNSLVIRVVMRNTAGSETLTLDNVLVSNTATLPVELISFSATLKSNWVHLNWQTASELLNSHFELEKSSNGIAFENIGIITTKGDEFSGANYQFKDPSSTQTVYYRLKQIDLDETFQYSQIISVEGNASPNNAPYPNPFADDLFLDLTTNSTLKFLSINGSQQKSIQLSAGRHNLSAYLSDFSNGLLVVTISSTYGTRNYKLVKHLIH
jgi:hypothetical protein